MPGISQELYDRCYNTLLKCSEFNNNSSVSAVFITKELWPFKTGLPGANSKAGRVTEVLNYLLEQEPDAGSPVLVMFLRALSSRYKPGNALLNELKTRAVEVEDELVGKGGSSEVPSNPPENALPGITVKLLTDVVPTAYCYQLTSEQYPLINVKADNTGQGNTNATLRIQADIKGYSDPTIATPHVAQGQQADINLLPQLRQQAVAKLNDMRPVTLHVKVEQTTPTPNLLYEQTHTIRLHACDTALIAVRAKDGSIVDLSDYLAAWVTPRSSMIEQLLRQAADHHPNKSFVGYQGVGSLAQRSDVVRAQAQAIFTALKQEANLTYINSTLNMGKQPGQVTQRVRLPNESLTAGGSANCMDGTVLFASLLELASLDPILVIVLGHAFVGWRIWRGEDQYEFLETTMIGSSDFASAQQRGRQQYEDALAKGYFSRGLFDPGGFARLVDVAVCRAKGVLPLA
jgi:hypothetical protein